MKALVYGHYFKFNIGDDLFQDAFKHLFPYIEFTFTDHITLENIKEVSVIIFGGGSFLFAKPNIPEDVYSEVLQKKIFYIGVGAETEIHPEHVELIKIAKLISIRSDHLDKILPLNINCMFCPDLVYSLRDKVVSTPKIPNSVLIIPNKEVVSRYTDPSWKQVAWEYFKSEFAQSLEVIQKDHLIRLFAFNTSNKMHDNWAGIEILNKMPHGGTGHLSQEKPSGIESITKYLSKFEKIITQRYHGIVLADLMDTACLTIHHHDKLKAGENLASYYGFNKKEFLHLFNNLSPSNQSIESNKFRELQDRVFDILKE